MPATSPLCDPQAWVDQPPIITRDEIYARLPQRHELALLDGIVHFEQDERFAVGFHDARPDHFWVRGHLPGRPLMPGVVMVEVAAQLCAWISTFFIPQDSSRFFGFAGVEGVRFRGEVRPGDRLLAAARIERLRGRFATCSSQCWVGEHLVYEGTILGAMI